MENWKAAAGIIKVRLSLISLLAIVGSSGCGGASSFTSSPSTPTRSPLPNPAPSVISISPVSGIAGQGAFRLVVSGNNFISSSTVQWNGSNRTTSYVSATRLTVAIKAADIARAGNAKVTVVNPAPGGGTSQALTFTMKDPVELQPPAIGNGFGAATIALNASTSLTFNIKNRNGTVALTGIRFSDALPEGLVVATPNGLTGSCGGGTVTAVAGSSSVSLSSAELAGGASCTFSVNVTGISAGVKNNITSAVMSNGGSGGMASASITVVAPPTIASLFGAATIPLNTSTGLTFTIGNPNGTPALSGVGFTDSLPWGFVVSTPSGINGSCGGGTITAVAGSASISLSDANLGAAASCTFTVDVTSTRAGVKKNTTSVVTSTQGGNGESASDSITVVAPPVISEVFGAASTLVGGSTSLSFSITNPNMTVALTDIGVSDTLPSGLVVAKPNSRSGSCGGGAITAAAGSANVSLSGAMLVDNASCTFAVNVTGSAVGTQTNITNVVTSSNGGNGNTATATVIVLAPSLINYFFNANTHGAPDGTLRITNPGTAAGGNLCADIFVFDTNQELSECCSCMTTPDDLLTLSLNTDLTGNPLTAKLLATGMITIVPATTQAGACPLPTTVTPEPVLQSWSTHIQSSSGFPATETEGQAAGLSAQNVTVLERQCAAIESLGSGRGVCASSAALAAICNN